MRLIITALRPDGPTQNGNSPSAEVSQMPSYTPSAAPLIGAAPYATASSRFAARYEFIMRSHFTAYVKTDLRRLLLWHQNFAVLHFILSSPQASGIVLLLRQAGWLRAIGRWDFAYGCSAFPHILSSARARAPQRFAVATGKPRHLTNQAAPFSPPRASFDFA